MHQLQREITLEVNREKLWEFIATPANLNLLTPPQLDFRIVSSPPSTMHNGLLINYRISIPRFGTWRWLTEIKHIHEGVSFVDEQRIGPYRLWYHQHHLEALSTTQTRMIDTVNYALPFGLLGEGIHKLLVKKMLEEIFDYREKRLPELFPPKNRQ